MQGFHTAAHRLAQLPQQPQRLANGGPVGFGARGLSGLRDLVPKMAAMGYPQSAPAPAPATATAPVSDPRAAQLMAMIPRMEAMGYKQQPQFLAKGGLVRGPGTGTSDSIETEAEPGTFIMPADSTQAIGPSALEKLGTVPVRLSDGEFKMPPEQVMALGAAVLKLLKDTTHTPVNGEDGGQTDAEAGEAMLGGQEDEAAAGMGYGPADRMAQMPPMMFADGGLVENNVTRVGNSYSGGNVSGGIAVNGQAPGGTVSTSSWASPAPAHTTAATSAAAPAAPAASPAPAAPMGWAERNALRNTTVTASSIIDSPERRAAQAALTPPPAPVGFQSASQRLGSFSDPRSAMYDPNPYAASNAEKLAAPVGFQPRRYADGGVVEDDRAVFGFYPQLTDHGKTSRATADKLQQGVQATGPTSFQPAAPAAEPPPAPAATRMNSLTDPRSLAFAGTREPAAQTPAPQGSGALSRAATMAGPAAPTSPAPAPAGEVSAQNMGAADGLARRGAAEAMALMPNAPAPVQAPTIRNSTNDWAARKNLENLATAASSITNDKRWGGEGEKSQDRLALAQAQATDATLQMAQPSVDAAAMRENADNMRAQMQARSAAAQAQAAERGAMERTLVTERGNNTRAGITALAGLEEARMKAGVAGPKLTEDQAKSAGYALRMDNALKLINEIGAKNPGATRPGVGTSLLNALPEGVANYLRPEDRQRVEAAQLDALDAALTLNTGAAYTREQLLGLSRSYFPQPGDDPKTIAEKQTRLASQIETARLRAGPGGSAMADAAQAKVGSATVSGQPQRVESQQAFAALPSGSRFVAPDGSVRIKP